MRAPVANRPCRNRSETIAADHLLRSTYAMVLVAGGRGSRLQQLTDGCAKPAVPFAGRLKIIDFT
jgi:glucose-1-phosphate adenylyltransferase